MNELLKKSLKINNTRALYRCVPTISARFWAIFDSQKKTFVHGHREYIKRECASLTKMMTALTVVRLCRRFKLNLNSETIKISGVASNIRGTTANLRKNDVLSIEQLLYGMMLPSGNDAAFALASHFGNLIFQKYNYTEKDIENISSFQFNYHPYFVKYFLKEMNVQAEKIGLASTNFDSPHGLQNVQNLSTAYDMCKLAHAMMQEPVLKRISATAEYQCEPIINAHDVAKEENNSGLPDEKYVSPRKTKAKKENEEEYKATYIWENTNKLLGVPGFVGCKTGITPAAGPCLAAAYENKGH